MFLPLAGGKGGWKKLRRDVGAELNEVLWQHFHGTVPLPSEAGKYRKVAVRIVDGRGIEALKTMDLA